MKHRWQPWTFAEDRALEILLQHMTYRDAAEALGRTEAAVKTHAKELGLYKRPVYQAVWTTKMERRLLDMRKVGATLREIAQELGVTEAAARNKWWRLRRQERAA